MSPAVCHRGMGIAHQGSLVVWSGPPHVPGGQKWLTAGTLKTGVAKGPAGPGASPQGNGISPHV